MTARLSLILGALVLVWASGVFAGDKRLPPSVGGPASTSASASGVTASPGPKSDAARKKSGSASRAASDERLGAKFVACRDTRGGPAQRACEADYATFVAGNFR